MRRRRPHDQPTDTATTRRRGTLTVADDGTATQPGVGPRAWLDLPEGVMLFTMSGEAQDLFTAAFASVVTLPPGYKLQLVVLSTPTTAEAAVAAAFADLAPPTAALTDLKERLKAGWTAYLGQRFVPRHRFLAVVTGPTRARRDTSLNLVVDEVQRGLHRMGVHAQRLGGADVRALLAAYPDERPPESLEDVHGIDAHGRPWWACSFYLLVPPLTTNPGFLAPLLAFPAPLRLAIHITGLDQDKERTLTKKRNRNLGDVVVGAGVRGREADVDAEDAKNEARGQARRMRAAGAAIVRCGLYVTVFAPDRDSVHRRADALWGQLTSSGGLDAKAARARGHQRPLAAATKPLGLDPARATYRMEAETLANAWPCIVHQPGHPDGVPIAVSAIDNALVRLNIRHRSMKNRLISTFGGSGQGKTFFVQMLILWFMLWDAWATAIDTVGGYEAIAGISDGATIRLGGPGTAAINIWDGPRATPEELAARTRFVVRAHEVLLSAAGRLLDDLARAAIGEGVRAVYTGYRAADADHRSEAETPLERDLVAWLEGQARAQEDYEDRRLYKTLAARLASYVRDGEHAALVDRPTSFRINAHLLGIQIDRKDLGGDTPIYAFVMFALTDLVDRRHRLAKAWFARTGRGTVLHFLAWDEGWALLKHPAGQEWVSGTGLTGRHDAVIADFISQKISHLAKGAAADFFDQASLHFILNMHDTNDESGVDPRKWVAGKLGLTAAESARLAVLKGEEGTHSQMLMIRTSKYGQPARGVVNVPATIKEVYWLFASDPDDKEVRGRMVRAVARDPERPTGDEVWRAVCLLAAGKTPEGVTPAITAAALEATTVAVEPITEVA
jgi:hypothetical protein